VQPGAETVVNFDLALRPATEYSANPNLRNVTK